MAKLVLGQVSESLNDELNETFAGAKFPAKVVILNNLQRDVYVPSLSKQLEGFSKETQVFVKNKESLLNGCATLHHVAIAAGVENGFEVSIIESVASDIDTTIDETTENGEVVNQDDTGNDETIEAVADSATNEATTGKRKEKVVSGGGF